MLDNGTVTEPALLEEESDSSSRAPAVELSLLSSSLAVELDGAVVETEVEDETTTLTLAAVDDRTAEGNIDDDDDTDRTVVLMMRQH